MDTGRLWNMEDSLQGLGWLNCCCLDSSGNQCSSCSTSLADIHSSLVKQWFALPELHLLWILAQLSRISL